MIHTRKKTVGREPTLRDDILDLLLDMGRPVSAREIAEALSINKTTPFRPLQELILMDLVEKDETQQVMSFKVKTENVVKFFQDQSRKSA